MNNNGQNLTLMYVDALAEAGIKISIEGENIHFSRNNVELGKCNLDKSSLNDTLDIITPAMNMDSEIQLSDCREEMTEIPLINAAYILNARQKNVDLANDEVLKKHELYEIYKARWVKDNISDEVMAETRAAYANSEESKEITFGEYVDKHGFTNGSCYIDRKEFFHKGVIGLEHRVAYENYEAEWVKEHISEAVMRETYAAYKNDENARDITFPRYVFENGYTNGEVYNRDYIGFCDSGAWKDYSWEHYRGVKEAESMPFEALSQALDDISKGFEEQTRGETKLGYSVDEAKASSVKEAKTPSKGDVGKGM